MNLPWQVSIALAAELNLIKHLNFSMMAPPETVVKKCVFLSDFFFLPDVENLTPVLKYIYPLDTEYAFYMQRHNSCCI